MASLLLPIETHDFAGVIEAKSASLLRELLRKSAQAGITSASHLEMRPRRDCSSGIRQVDALTGGLPRGCLTEVSGADSSGRTSLMLSALSAATRREEICALIDVSDAFDPYSAPRRLEWTWTGFFGGAERTRKLLLCRADAASPPACKNGNAAAWKIRGRAGFAGYGFAPAKQRLRYGCDRPRRHFAEDGAPHPADHLVPLPASRGKHSSHSAGDWQWNSARNRARRWL